MFLSSSKDLLKMIKRRNLSEVQVDDYFKRGLFTQWLTTPKNFAHGRPFSYASAKTGWKRGISRRVGVLAKKIGMRNDVDEWGLVRPVTILQLQQNQVIQVKGPKDHQTENTERPIWSLQVGAGLRKWKNLTKAQQGHLAKVDVPPKEVIVEFRVTKEAVIPPGTEIPVTHFVVGQFLDVKGLSKGKGTEGVMKRWGFAGGPASHGSSLQHRKPGSIAGGNTTPGRVWKGKHMAGRMGRDWVTLANLRLVKINTQDDLLYVQGSVPGPSGAWVQVRDAIRRPPRLPPPFPTSSVATKNRKKKYLRMRRRDPYKKSRNVDWDTRWADARFALRSAQQQGLLDEGYDEGEIDEFAELFGDK